MAKEAKAAVLCFCSMDVAQGSIAMTVETRRTADAGAPESTSIELVSSLASLFVAVKVPAHSIFGLYNVVHRVSFPVPGPGCWKNTETQEFIWMKTPPGTWPSSLYPAGEMARQEFLLTLWSKMMCSSCLVADPKLKSQSLMLQQRVNLQTKMTKAYMYRVTVCGLTYRKMPEQMATPIISSTPQVVPIGALK